ncbi:P-loop containing nucleoside triphosphate hydrolase protein [Penicillium angulare]|uniref:P-loop containing nucleoside triphosphate hydrolase protein n=1 Tax=Penicillium angulare TaxID=116970 RepID=UPI0025411440|nr:P-loop containing nucleoside triphosphate hydrolase protein [Penicillium angulare]KAJ5273605.1 P-loop containing nucleoside triphosphate hydrolase protein [Penicillium angulare]
MGFADGYDSIIGRTGTSSGQEQRIAIARVFLRSAPIILLDKFTSNIDLITETKLVASLER